MPTREGFMATAGGIRLYYCVWEPEGPVGNVVIVHGTNEHMGRYEHVAAYFCRRGMAVYGLDQRGFGRSGGVRCYVDRFGDYLGDLHAFLEYCRIDSPVLLGHSLGGLIAYRYAVIDPDRIAAVVLSSPFFGLRWRSGPVLEAAAAVLSLLAPRLQIPVRVPAELLTRSPAAMRAYRSDPLVGRSITPRWLAECLRAGKDARTGRSGDLRRPALFLQAGDDFLVSPEATWQVFQRVSHPQKAFRLYRLKYHEIFNDPGYQKALDEVWQWLNEEGLAHLK